MASGNYLIDKGYNAAAALTKYRAVKYSGNPEEVTPVTGITDDPAGWAQFGVTAPEITKGKGATVRLMGITEAEAAGAISVGAWCQLEADGRVSARVGASGKKLVGKCVGEAATTAGDRITMLIIPTFAVA
jgi:Uncharacterized conserved protein (DUF2190)